MTAEQMKQKAKEHYLACENFVLNYYSPRSIHDMIVPYKPKTIGEKLDYLINKLKKK